MKAMLRVIDQGDAAEADFRESLSLSIEEKLDILQALRELVYDLTHEDRKGFQRVLRISRLEKS
jgi:hypothetical protein